MIRMRHSVAAAAGVAAVLVAGTAAGAAANRTGSFTAPPASLRALASHVGLRIGTAVDPSKLGDPAYERITADQFSTVTPENAMKWEVVEPTRGHYDWSSADQLVRFAEQHGQLVRGHTLLWHSQLPGWLTRGVADGTIDNSQLKSVLHKHVTDEVRHFRGRIWQWDVANEMFANSWDPHPLADGINGDDFWVQHLGEGIIADAFRWAHAADPHALLFYNDYNITGEDGTNAKADAVYAWAKRMRSQGVPIDGIGEQGHLDTQYGFPDRMTDDFARFAGAGLKVAVTEADVRTFVDSPTTQNPTDHLATFAQPYEYSQMLKACLAVRQCISFTVWGFDDADSWIPGTFAGEGYGDIYDVNLNPKPAYFDLQQDLQLAAHGAAERPGWRSS